MRHLALFLIAFSFFLFLIPVKAQQTYPFDLSLSPSVVEVAVKPGKLVTQAFSVENAGNTDLEVTPVLQDIEALGQQGQVRLLETQTFPYGILQNADRKLNESFILPANATQQLVLGIDIPEDAVEKDWYFALVIQTKPSQGTLGAQSGAQTSGWIASNLLVRVSTTNQEPLHWDLEFENFPTWIDSLQTATFRPIAKNLSTTFATPDLSVVILDWKKNIVYENDGLPDRVLAQNSREILASQPRKDDPRSFEGIPFTFDPLFAFGPYTVRATIRNNAEGPLVVEKTFRAYPFSLVLAGTGLVIGLVIVRMFLVEKKKKKYTQEE